MAFNLGSLLGNIGGSLFSGIGGLISTNQTNKANLAAVREQNRANRELAELQYKRDLEMWERQNVYNSPQEQIKRLTDAGLNPNLIYGNGSTATGNASSPPSYNAPHIDRYNTQDATGIGQFAGHVGQGISDIGQMMLLSAQIDAQHEIAENWKLKNRRLAEESPYFTEMAQYKADKLKYGTFKLQFDGEVNRYLANHAEEYARQVLDNKIKLNLLTDSKIKLTNRQVNEISQKISLMTSQIALNNANADLSTYKAEIERVLAEEGLNLRDGTDRVISAVMSTLSQLKNVDPDAMWGLGKIARWIGQGADNYGSLGLLFKGKKGFRNKSTKTINYNKTFKTN